MRAGSVASIRLRYARSYPGVEWRLRGWPEWKAHMTRLTGKNIVGFHEGARFALLTDDARVMAMPFAGKEKLILEAAQEPKPRVETPGQFLRGLIRYVKWKCS